MAVIEAAIEYELQHGCRLRPAKRMALELAIILCKERQTPDQLTACEAYLRGIRERIERARV